MSDYNYYGNKSLHNLGIRPDMLSLEQQMIMSHSVSEAWCSSQACAGSRCTSKKGVKKAVTKGTERCPDCSSTLFWTKRPVNARK